MLAARTTLFLLAVVTVTAAEQPAPAPEKNTPPPSEDAIAVAKREFDAVKAARGLPNTAGSALPSFAPPEFPAASSGATPLTSQNSRIDAALAAKKKSANWLLDAMTEKKDRDKRALQKGERETDKDKLDLAGDSRTDESADKEKFDTANKPREQMANPLDRYMTSWMTPQDLEMLRPAMKDGAALPNHLDAALPAFGAAGIPGASQSDQIGALLPGLPAPGERSAPHENPFLQSIASSSSPLSGLAPPAPSVAPVSAPPPATSLVPPPLFGPPAQKSATPSFVKPRDDEKYYKQMKRF